MNNFYQKIDLPKVPEHLIMPFKDMQSLPNQFINKKADHTYKIVEINSDLQEWVEEIFQVPCVTKYQIINQDLPYHKDYGEESFKFNYLITLGGPDVKTFWKKSDQIVAELKAEINTWYKIHVHIEHAVSGLVTPPRLSLVVRPQAPIFY